MTNSSDREAQDVMGEHIMETRIIPEGESMNKVWFLLLKIF